MRPRPKVKEEKFQTGNGRTWFETDRWHSIPGWPEQRGSTRWKVVNRRSNLEPGNKSRTCRTVNLHLENGKHFKIWVGSCAQARI